MSVVGDLLAALLAEVEAALTDAGAPVARSAVVVGEVAWDDCCEGYLYTAAARLFDSQRFPVEDLSWTPCQGGAPAAEIVVGLLRCAPVPAEDGSAPPPADLTAAALLLYEDAETVLLALRTYLCEQDVDTVIAGQTFIGAAGGCIAVETRILVALS